MNADTRTDRGTWVRFRNRRDSGIVRDGGDVLFNQYGSILVNPERHSWVKVDPVRRWQHWLVSEAGQALIADYRLDGEQWFFPNATG